MTTLKIHEITAPSLSEIELFQRISPALTTHLLLSYSATGSRSYRLRIDDRQRIGSEWLRDLSLHSTPPCFLASEPAYRIHSIDVLKYALYASTREGGVEKKVRGLAMARCLEYYLLLEGLTKLSARQLKQSYFIQTVSKRLRAAARDYELDLPQVLSKAVLHPIRVFEQAVETYCLLAHGLLSSRANRDPLSFLRLFRSRINTAYAISDIVVFDLHHGFSGTSKANLSKAAAPLKRLRGSKSVLHYIRRVSVL